MSPRVFGNIIRVVGPPGGGGGGGTAESPVVDGATTVATYGTKVWHFGGEDGDFTDFGGPAGDPDAYDTWPPGSHLGQGSLTQGGQINTGSWAWDAYITDTVSFATDPTRGQSKLEKWQTFDYPWERGYHSVWMYIPSSYHNSIVNPAGSGQVTYINVMQWKSRGTGGSNVQPTFIVSIQNPASYPAPGVVMHDWGPGVGFDGSHLNSSALVPADEWFCLTVYASKSYSTGEIRVWINETKYFDFTGLNTLWEDAQGTPSPDWHTGIGNYVANYQDPFGTHRIYFDDWIVRYTQ